MVRYVVEDGKFTHFQEFNPSPRILKLLDVSSNHLTSEALTSSLREVELLQCLRAKKNRLGGTKGDQVAAGSVWRIYGGFVWTDFGI